MMSEAFLYDLASFFNEMKTFIICVVLIQCLMVQCAMAQSYSVGAGLAYGDDIREPGINFRGYYNLADNRICFGPEFTYFKKRTENSASEEIDISLFEINLNAHYLFEVTHKLGIYPVIGLNYSQEKEDYTDTEEEVTEKKWGMNVGAGTHYTVNKFTVFLEYDHLFSDLSQNTFILGAFYTFGKKSEERE